MTQKIDDFFDKEHHYQKMQRNAQKIRSKQPQAQASHYLNDLFDYFISDIQDIAKQIYDKIVLQHSAGETKVSPTELQRLIKSMTESFLEDYNRIVQGYNMGGMFREYDNVEKDITAFKIRAKNTCAEESKNYSLKYDNYLRKCSDDKSMLTWAKRAGIASIAGFIVTAILGVWNIVTPNNIAAAHTPNDKSGTQITYSYTGYLEKQLAVDKLTVQPEPLKIS